MVLIFLALIFAHGAIANAESPNIRLGAKSLNDFSLSLHKKLAANANEDENVALSALSVFTAFSAVALGAEGETRDELENALKWRDVPGFEASLGTFFYHLMRGNDKEVLMANKLFVAQDFKIRRQYMRQAKKYFLMKSQSMDFSQPEESRRIINQWVQTQTKGMINEIVPQGALGSLTRLVLANSIYFKGAWKSKFDVSKTQTGVFEANSGPVDVEYMIQEKGFPIAYMDDGDVLELPYQGDRISMFCILPYDMSVGELENKMTMEKIEKMITSVSETTAKIYVPKFEIDFEASLRGDVLNMSKVFDPNQADLGRLTDENGLYVSQALHKTIVKVDEEGTVASALTALIFETRSYPAELKLNRPFLFYIIHKESGAIMFSGRIMNPSKV